MEVHHEPQSDEVTEQERLTLPYEQWLATEECLFRLRAARYSAVLTDDLHELQKEIVIVEHKLRVLQTMPIKKEV